jgi:cysteine desulfurase
MVSIIGVHNEMGTIQDIVSLKNTIKGTNPITMFHVDGVQWFGKYKMPTPDNMPDFMTFSGHKLHGPRGIGGILKNPNTPLKPLIHGGGQESRFRSGTENLPAIAGLAQALQDQNPSVKPILQSYQTKIFDFVKNHSTINWIGYPPSDKRSPFINLITLKNKKSEVLIHQLAEQEIYISSGSACSEKSGKNQSNWSFLELPTEYQEGILRISFSYETTENEIDLFLAALDKLV